MYKSKLYLYSPIKFQVFLINFKAFLYKALRENVFFTKRVKLLVKNSKLTRSEFLQIKDKELNKTVAMAAHTEAYKNYSLAFESFPITYKCDIQANCNAYINPKTFKLFHFKSSTGGTTGKPLSIYSSLSSIIEDHAQSYRQLLWAGYKKGDKKLWLRADLIVPLDQKLGPFSRVNYVDNMLMMSAFHINNETVKSYVDDINNYNPQIIQAYPSAICLLAQLIESRSLNLNLKLKAVILSSESYSEEQKILIERVFDCRVFSWYGLSERVANVGTCSEGELHLIEDYGTHEFDDENVLIATGFHNKVMPIIKYYTGDKFQGVEKETDYVACACGVPFRRVAAIDGRVGEFLISSNGSKVSIFNHIPKGVDGLVELQLNQYKLNEIKVLVVANDLFDKSSAALLTSNVQQYLGAEMSVVIELVAKIKRTKSGKFRQAIYHIKD